VKGVTEERKKGRERERKREDRERKRARTTERGEDDIENE
jgi:hypothetical protein